MSTSLPRGQDGRPAIDSELAFIFLMRFTMLLIGVILILGALTFFPALSLGPILEHLLMAAGKTF